VVATVAKSARNFSVEAKFVPVANQLRSQEKSAVHECTYNRTPEEPMKRCGWLFQNLLI